jgi:hypothetical protein
MTHPVVFTDWHGCYDQSWKGLIVEEAFVHPAKFSYALICRIVEHGLQQGYWRPGDLIGDPFGGVALGGIICGGRGLNWVGVELEPKFVELGNRNLEMHGPAFMASGSNLVVLRQGDSRRFAGFVGGLDGSIGSPPFGERRDGQGIAQDGQTSSGRPLGRSTLASGVVTSPPYQKGIGHGGASVRSEILEQEKSLPEAKYGHSDGQIGNLPRGSLDCVITSPPYADALNAGGPDTAHPDGFKRMGHGVKARYGTAAGQIGTLPAGQVDSVITSPPFTQDQPCAAQSKLRGNIGRNADGKRAAGMESPAQIGTLPAGTIDGAVTSPPWEANCEGGFPAKKFKQPTDALKADRGHGASDEARVRQLERDQQKTYGDSPGQIGRQSGETYWQAMRQVYAQMHLAMSPGGVAAIVVKDYVKNKARVPLCDDTWRRSVSRSSSARAAGW